MDEAPADDDSVAAMLLSLQDDAGAGLLGGDVPEGSTVMDIGVPPLNPDGTLADPKKDDKAKAASPSTSNAAKALLEKYMRRPR